MVVLKNAAKFAPKRIIIMTLMLFAVMQATMGCNVSLSDDFGMTYPSFIEVNVNQPFTIVCEVKSIGINQTLRFSARDLHLGESLVVDPTFIMLNHFFNESKSVMIFCLLDDAIVGSTRVIASLPIFNHLQPALTTNFQCVTRDLKTLNCGFLELEAEEPIDYRLDILRPREFDGDIKVCDLQHHGHIYNCKIDLTQYYTSTDILERRFNFHLKLGKYMSNSVQVPLIETVKPRKIYNPTVTRVNGERMLTFCLSPAILDIYDELEFKVKYQSEYMVKQNEWKMLRSAPELQTDGTISFSLKELKKPFTNYIVAVKTKPRRTRSVTYWSEWSKISFKTDPKIPKTVPQICPSCYYYKPNGDAKLFWHPVKQSKANGPNVVYEIYLSQFAGVSVPTPYYVVRRDDQINDTMHFTMWTWNSKGKSKEHTNFILDRTNLTQNLVVHKVRTISTSSRTADRTQKCSYNVEWFLKNRPAVIDSFTVFWCKGELGHDDDCLSNAQGKINYRNVGPDVRNFVMQKHCLLNFAVSANYEGSSDMRMRWANSTWLENFKLVNKVKVSQKTNSSIELNWSANCTVKNILTFAVSYCPVPQENSSNCTAERKIQYFDCPQSVMKLKDLQTDRWHQINVTFQSTTQMFPQQKLSVKTSTTLLKNVQFKWESHSTVPGTNIYYNIFMDGFIQYKGHSTDEILQYFLSVSLQNTSQYSVVILACEKIENREEYICVVQSDPWMKIEGADLIAYEAVDEEGV